MSRARRIGGAVALLALCLSSAPLRAADAPAPRDPVGTWQGTLRGAVRLVFHIERSADGTLAGKMDSPDQGAIGLVLDEVRFANDSLTATLKIAGGLFVGRMNGAGDTLSGEWRQNGAVIPLALKHSSTSAGFNRPQDPVKPYPYEAEDVTYENARGGVKLAGTLTHPAGAGPFPAAILITGSGTENRDEEIFGHRPFLVIADALTRRGIAVLRVDDRGIGGSTGDPRTGTTEDFAGDVEAGIAFLKTRKDIDAKHIGLIGHSEGGLIAPMVATRGMDVAFIVLLAGPGIRGDSILYLQSAAIRRAVGADETIIQKERAVQERLYPAVVAGADSTIIAGMVRELMQAQGIPEPSERVVRGQTSMVMGPWFKYFLSYDPQPVLAKVKCPVLALNGERDTQVPPKENLSAIERSLRAGGNKDFKVQQLPKLNHLFQTAVTGASNEYAGIDETFAPVALQTMGDWIVARTLKKK